MTEETQLAIEDAPQEEIAVAENDGAEPTETDEPDAQETVVDGEDVEGGEDVEFPKKAVNALNRKNKQINKLRAQMRELNARLNEAPVEPELEPIDESQFETWDELNNAKIKASVEQQTKQFQSEMQRQQLAEQQRQLQAQRDQHIAEQASEVAKALPDSQQVWNENAQLLDSLPEQIADIFYSIDNAPAAVYALAKEGKLESLLYANPAVAAYEIVNAQNKGLEAMSRPTKTVSQAPTPIQKAKGTGSVKKQLSPSDDVLKSLGFK